MSRAMFTELKQVCAEMKAIVERSEREGRRTSRQEQDLLNQLAATRETLLGDIICHGHGPVR